MDTDISELVMIKKVFRWMPSTESPWPWLLTMSPGIGIVRLPTVKW